MFKRLSFYVSLIKGVDNIKGIQRRIVQTKRIAGANDTVSNFTERYLELGIVTDPQVKALHDNNDAFTADYLLMIANIVSNRFSQYLC
jgi:uncharacterized membrane protein